MNKYAAFLRGINVGGNKIIKMDDLKKAFEKLKLKNVKTILASGNVLFETEKIKPEILTKKIEEHLLKTFEKQIYVVIRTFDVLKNLADSKPFKDIDVTKQTRLYVTFFYDKPKTKLPISNGGEGSNFIILSQTDTEICCVLIVTPEKNTIDLMNVIDKEYGKKVTTRNWNTIEKILKAY